MLADLILRTAVERSLVTRGAVDAARGEGRDPASAETLAVLYSEGTLCPETVLEALADTFALPIAEVGQLMPSPEALALLTVEQIHAAEILPLTVSADTLTIALKNPLKLSGLADLEYLLGLRIDPWLADAAQFQEAWNRTFGVAEARPEPVVPASASGTAAARSEESSDKVGSAPHPSTEDDGAIVQYVNQLVAEALARRASDIHLEPMEQRFRVRLRIDGRLQEAGNPGKHLQLPIVSRLKLMAGMSIAEKRVPQDGRIRMQVGSRAIDLRVSSLPSVFGETLVLRILDRENLRLGLDELGFLADHREQFERLIARPDGIFLVTGPTGSGKSTTLYGALHHLNGPDRKIITVEDPVEYQLSGINQVSVRREIGMDFAVALRAMLRQAPNIIMVGEIRDRETAEIAINAAFTGHMVFSTLHTNDAPSALSRLVDIGVKPFLVAAALRGVLAQRLVRRVCPHCAVQCELDTASCVALGLSTEEARNCLRGRGCARCSDVGYHGRRGIFELLETSEEIARLIYQQANGTELRRRARELGMRTMREDGGRKVAAGITTAEEVLAVTLDDAL